MSRDPSKLGSRDSRDEVSTVDLAPADFGDRLEGIKGESDNGAGITAARLEAREEMIW